MAYFGVDADVRVKEQILHFQNVIRQRMTTSTRSLANIFKSIDHNESGCLSREEFEAGLAAFG